jgi:hypothetical protein
MFPPTRFGALKAIVTYEFDYILSKMTPEAVQSEKYVQTNKLP